MQQEGEGRAVNRNRFDAMQKLEKEIYWADIKDLPGKLAAFEVAQGFMGWERTALRFAKEAREKQAATTPEGEAFVAQALREVSKISTMGDSLWVLRCAALAAALRLDEERLREVIFRRTRKEYGEELTDEQVEKKLLGDVTVAAAAILCAAQEVY